MNVSGNEESDNRQSEDMVRNERDHLQQYLDLAPVMFIVIDRNGDVRLINRKGAEVLGYPPEEIIGKNWYATFLPSPVRDVVSSRLMNLVVGDNEPGDEIGENLVLTNEGEYRRILWHNAVMHNADGMITGTLSSGEDVTAIREAEKDLHLKNAAIESTQSGVALLSMDGRIRYANAALVQMLGYEDAAELLGRSLTDQVGFHEKGKDVFRVVTETGSWYGEQHAMMADGHIIGLLISATVIFDNEEKPMNIVVSFMDITEMERYRTVLREVNTKLNILSSFTRHDILNQVQVLLAYAELLKETTPDDAPGRDYINKMFEATQRINSQISFSRDYQDLGVRAPRWQGVHVLCEEGTRAVYNAKIMVSCAVPESLEIYADTMIEKVLYNLFDNAQRHGGTVTGIELSFTEETDGSGTLLVADNGVGVPENQKERIFERGVGSNTGLGLFIIREVLGITGCSITETGTEGEGACFSIHIPGGIWRYGHP